MHVIIASSECSGLQVRLPGPQSTLLLVEFFETAKLA